MAVHLASTGVGGPGGSTILLQDSFTDTNGTSLDAHTMDVGAGWTEHSANWDIQSNRANNNATTGNTTADAGAGDVTCQCTVQIPSGASTGQQYGTLLRFQNSSNYWRLTIQTAAGTNFKLTEVNAGAATDRSSSNESIASATDYVLKAVCSGASIDCHLDGVSKHSYGSATFNQTETRFGLRCAATANGRWEDFSVVQP